jgi:hypothetical protein
MVAQHYWLYKIYRSCLAYNKTNQPKPTRFIDKSLLNYLVEVLSHLHVLFYMQRPVLVAAGYFFCFRSHFRSQNYSKSFPIEVPEDFKKNTLPLLTCTMYFLLFSCFLDLF